MNDPYDVVAFGAHPDDAEIGCGATLAAAAARGQRVAIVDLTAGERATRGTPDLRRAEAQRAAEALGVSHRRALGLSDGSVGVAVGDREAIVTAIRDMRPRIVLAPYPSDRHPDHGAAGRLVVEAAYLAGLGGPQGHRPARVYHYMIHHAFVPSFVVDAGACWARKMDALAMHRSQFGSEGPATPVSDGTFLETVEARGVYFGSLIGVARGEPFWSSGPVPAATLPDEISGPGYAAYP